MMQWPCMAELICMMEGPWIMQVPCTMRIPYMVQVSHMKEIPCSKEGYCLGVVFACAAFRESVRPLLDNMPVIGVRCKL